MTLWNPLNVFSASGRRAGSDPMSAFDPPAPATSPASARAGPRSASVRREVGSPARSHDPRRHPIGFAPSEEWTPSRVSHRALVQATSRRAARQCQPGTGRRRLVGRWHTPEPASDASAPVAGRRKRPRTSQAAVADADGRASRRLVDRRGAACERHDEEQSRRRTCRSSSERSASGARTRRPSPIGAGGRRAIRPPTSTRRSRTIRPRLPRWSSSTRPTAPTPGRDRRG